MKRILLTLIVLLIMIKVNAQNQVLQPGKDLNHIDNEQLTQEKKDVLKTVKEFGEWFMEANHFIRYDYRAKKWEFSTGLKEFPHDISNEDRINLIANTIILSVKASNLLSETFKDKIVENHHDFEDPGNLTFLMTESKYGKETFYLLIYWESGFITYLGKADLLYSDNPDYVPDLPKITEEDKINYYYEMISINDGKATLVIDLGAVTSDPPMLYEQYIVFSLKKIDEVWKMNNLQILYEGDEIINK